MLDKDFLTLKNRVSIEISIDAFGTPEDKAIWAKWCQDKPQDRSSNLVRDVIVRCLRRRHEFILRQMGSPIARPEEIAELCCVMKALEALWERLESEAEWATTAY